MLDRQISLFDITDSENGVEVQGPDLGSYDYYIVAMSAGKDSLACLLYLLDNDIPKDKIELWHHCVDGKDAENGLMDWPVTEDYCRKLADAFGVPLFFSWKKDGFEGEMLRENAKTKPTFFETPEGTFQSGGTGGKLGTRRQFPQLAASLSSRWCSSYLKIDPSSKAITGQLRFAHKRTLFVTGERAQESPARSKYLAFEPHRTDRRSGRLGRHVDHFRPVHAWKEEAVWEIIERYKVRPHPAYQLGWGRLSCMSCVFASSAQWASIKLIDPDRFERIAAYEEEFGKTIHRKKSIREQVVDKRPYESISADRTAIAMSRSYKESIFMDSWCLPAGAYGENAGPT